MTPLVRLSPLALACAMSFATPADAVNLVPNDSFETYTSCPTSFSQLSNATPWDVPTQGTSDLYNACVTGFPPFPVPGMPGSPFGFQYSRTGNGHAGFTVRNVNDYHEYITVPLNAPLVANASYTVGFYVNLADTCDSAIDRIGAHFSAGPIGPLNINTTLNLVPQVESPANIYLTDTVNWMLITGTFVAAGGENYMTIGNFHDDASTNWVPTGNTWPGAHYYIDDDSVEFVNNDVDQACCGADGTCSIMLPGECQASGGTPLGVGSSCDPDPCGPTVVTKKSWGALKSIYR
jgi:hypothetical protein